MATDPLGANWLVTASSRGALTLWDMRFRVPLSSRQLPAAGPAARPVHVDALAPALAPGSRLGLVNNGEQPPPSSPLVYVAAGPHEVSLWDIERWRCHQVWVVTMFPGENKRHRRKLALHTGNIFDTSSIYHPLSELRHPYAAVCCLGWCV